MTVYSSHHLLLQTLFQCKSDVIDVQHSFRTDTFIGPEDSRRDDSAGEFTVAALTHVTLKYLKN